MFIFEGNCRKIKLLLLVLALSNHGVKRGPANTTWHDALQRGSLRKPAYLLLSVPDHLLELVVGGDRLRVVLQERFDIVVDFLLTFQLAVNMAFYFRFQSH